MRGQKYVRKTALTQSYPSPPLTLPLAASSALTVLAEVPSLGILSN